MIPLVQATRDLEADYRRGDVPDSAVQDALLSVLHVLADSVATGENPNPFPGPREPGSQCLVPVRQWLHQNPSPDVRSAALAHLYELWLAQGVPSPHPDISPQPHLTSRVSQGSFYTPRREVDIACAEALDLLRLQTGLTLPSPLAVCDPAAGCGEFLLGICRHVPVHHPLILVAADRDTTALTIACFRIRLVAGPHVTVRCLTGDSLLAAGSNLSVNPGFRWKQAAPSSPEPASEQRRPADESDAGPFHLLVTNPPYLRAEAIRCPACVRPAVSPDSYKELLRKALTSAVGKTRSSAEGKTPVLPPLAHGRMDLSAWFVLLAQRLLRDRGVMALVLSDSWLDSQYGDALQARLAQGTNRILVPAATRTFQDAGVLTSILIHGPAPAHAHGPAPAQAHGPAPSDGLPGGCDDLDISSRPLPGMPLSEVDPASHPVAASHRRICLPCPVPQRDGWGPRYVRMPQLLQVGPHWCRTVPLGELLHLRYGLKTGLSDFFVLPSDDPKARSIEPNYLRPFVTQSLELYCNHISSSRSTAQLFVCHTSKERLHDLRHDGALQHVLEGEASFTRTRAKHSLAQVPYPLVASVSEHRPYWYSVRPQVPGCVVLPCIIHRHHAVAWNPDRLLVSNNFFHGEPVGDVDPLVLLAILNSRFVALMMEVFGRPKGMGALNLYGPDLARLPVPDPRQFPAELSARLRNAFLRRIESTEPSDPASTAFTEDPVNEWTEDALGLGPAMRQVVRAALTERLELRLARGRTRSG